MYREGIKHIRYTYAIPIRYNAGFYYFRVNKINGYYTVGLVVSLQ